MDNFQTKKQRNDYMRDLYSQGANITEIARIMSLSRGTVYRALQGGSND
ncbi:helix-turn-helix domain-containing protein [Shewanella sp. MBTL60-007]|nr:helix-turn-helix domain-containing protein [Shewanella sp. MBTL60-007]GIU31802.1 hypothetical protein TUM3792_43840 [Shewanella sp. MBTL60-007]